MRTAIITNSPRGSGFWGARSIVSREGKSLVSIFTNTTDDALDRWSADGYDYAIGVDREPSCPAGDVGSGRNAARRVGKDWFGDLQVVDDPSAATATTTYHGYEFEVRALGDSSLSAEDDAALLISMFPQWAEGDVYAIERGSDVVYGFYTADGAQPTRAEAQQAF